MRQYQYELTSNGNAAALARLLSDNDIAYKRNPSRSLTRIYYDTFDWRLFAKGYELIDEPQGDGHRLTLMQRDNGLNLVSMETVEAPGFAAALPPGMLRRRLSSVLSPRRMLELVRLQVKAQTLDVLDEQCKTVAHLKIERYGPVKGEHCEGRGPRSRVYLLPVRGFSEQSARIRRLLEKRMLLPRYQGDLLPEALQAIGRQPLEYVSKLSIALNPADDTGCAVQRICLHLLRTMEINEDGVRRDLDIEFLHDFRVAIRRTRVLLSHLETLLPGEILEAYRSEFAWLGGVTGPTRDLDVQLFEYPEYLAMLAPEYREDLQALHSLIQSRRESERKALLKALASVRYRRLRQNWRKFLENDGAHWRELPTARRPAIESARKLIWRRYDKVLKRGGRLQADAPDEAFHALRKECKKLRYLMEFFSSLFPGRDIKALIKVLKRLQDNLGGYQDLCILIDDLSNDSEQLREAPVCDNRTLRAIGMLVEALKTSKHEVHGEFVGVYDHFARKQHRQRFKSMFKPK